MFKATCFTALGVCRTPVTFNGKGCAMLTDTDIHVVAISRIYFSIEPFITKIMLNITTNIDGELC